MQLLRDVRRFKRQLLKEDDRVDVVLLAAMLSEIGYVCKAHSDTSLPSTSIHHLCTPLTAESYQCVTNITMLLLLSTGVEGCQCACMHVSSLCL
jgi:hypothetical protein